MMNKKKLFYACVLCTTPLFTFASVYDGARSFRVSDSGQLLVNVQNQLKQVPQGSTTVSWSFKVVPAQDSSEKYLFTTGGGLCLSLSDSAASMQPCASSDNNQGLRLLSVKGGATNVFQIIRVTKSATNTSICLTGDTMGLIKDSPQRTFKAASCNGSSTGQQFNVLVASSSSSNVTTKKKHNLMGSSSSSSGGSSSGSIDSGIGSFDGTTCKRGVAYHFNSLDEIKLLSKGVHWWYNWAPQPEDSVFNTNYASLMEFVPMVWGRKDMGKQLTHSSTVLGFNEPDLGKGGPGSNEASDESSGIVPEEAARLWPQVESMAKAAGITKIASPSPAMGPDWLDQFFAACNCLDRIDYIVVHNYGPMESLKSKVEQFKKYNKPIWVTEFACYGFGGSGPCSLEEQKALVNAAIPYLEGEPQVARYSWFGYPNVPNSELIKDGQITELGQIYVNLPGHCAQ